MIFVAVCVHQEVTGVGTGTLDLKWYSQLIKPQGLLCLLIAASLPLYTIGKKKLYAKDMLPKVLYFYQVLINQFMLVNPLITFLKEMLRVLFCHSIMKTDLH